MSETEQVPHLPQEHCQLQFNEEARLIQAFIRSKLEDRNSPTGQLLGEKLSSQELALIATLILEFNQLLLDRLERMSDIFRGQGQQSALR